MAPRKAQDILLGAVLGAVGAILGARCLRRAHRSVPELKKKHVASLAQQPSNGSAQVHTAEHTLTDEIISEQLTRNLQFFGEAAQQQLAKGFVVVVGLGVNKFGKKNK